MSTNNIIIIREYRNTDSPAVAETVRNAYLSNTMDSWISALTREITFQLIVMIAAVLFIFVGVPLSYCLMAIPMVMVAIYVIIYSSYLLKATELIHNKRPVKCWVAEACEPYFSTISPQQLSHRVVQNEDQLYGDDIRQVEKTRRRIIGTIAVGHYQMMDRSAWLYRFAVEKNYRKKGVGRALVQSLHTWCRINQYDRILLAVSECQDNARQLFTNNGFRMKQMYHKKIFASVITLLMYQLECDLMIPDF